VEYPFIRRATWILKKAGLIILVLAAAFAVWQLLKPVPTEGDWQEQLVTLSTAEFSGDTVTVRNVRNFRYGPTEADMRPAYYDRTYDLTDIQRVWFISEPFNENQLAAHTFLSFEFGNGDFLSISIEARKTKDQVYSIWKGLLRTYPLVYIAADERDTVLMRANIRKDRVYVYPVKLEKPENARLLLTSMLRRMNELAGEKPAWYHTYLANCTSSIAKHVNELSPGRISLLSWELLLTASADELAHRSGLLDTELSIDDARKKYQINAKSEELGDVPGYSLGIRRFEE
jgi:hypothetical protein